MAATTTTTTKTTSIPKTISAHLRAETLCFFRDSCKHNISIANYIEKCIPAGIRFSKFS